MDGQADPDDAGASIGSRAWRVYATTQELTLSIYAQQGGNDAFRSAFAAAGVPKGLSIAQKYNTPQAEAYRGRLSALVEGRLLPPSLPQWDPSCIQSSAAPSSSGSSFGSDSKGVEALKGESEADYVARQMRLRDEARARMQAKFGAGGMQGIGSSGETRAPQTSSGIPDLSRYGRDTRASPALSVSMGLTLS